MSAHNAKYWISFGLSALLLAGCGNSDSPAGPLPADGAVKVLSNRADLISGGDALVEIVLPSGGAAPKVTLNGQDVSGQFALSSSGRYMGLVTGLALGNNTLTAGSSSAAIVNHPSGGPIFAGPPLRPWKCRNAAALDAECNQPPEYRFFYKSTDPRKSGFQAYDPANPPSDVAQTTTDHGVTAPFIVRQELGYQDRDQYRIAVLFQPDQPWTAAEPQPQFNHKLVINHGSSCGVDYQSAEAPAVLSNNGVTSPPDGDATVYALGKGFAVMSTALNNAGHNCFLPLQAESLVMAKERLIEQYGELRYAIGEGCSGGSLTIQQVANAYPGIYQGILPTCSFPDAWSTATQFADYHGGLAYFMDPSKWGAGAGWTSQQMADVMGHVSIVNAQVSETAQWHVAVPTDPCAGVDPPAAGNPGTRYHPDTNPGGVRCDITAAAINAFGPRPPALWTAQEQQLGRGFAGFPLDNVGVQYGLAVLKAGTITPAQFVDLNVKVGGLDVDTNPIPGRTPAVEPALANAYRSGLINTTSNLNQTAIIDCRGPDPGAFHDAYRAFAIRARLDREHGNHDNQLIWEGPVLIQGDSYCAQNSLIAMDQWLAAAEQDLGAKPMAQKLTDNKPAGLGDRCYNGSGRKVSDGLCPEGVVPIYGTPRTVAGDAISTDTNKCQLKPLDRASPDYGLLPFTDAQWSQMQDLFAAGVCDYSKPGVSQQATIPWLTYQDASGTVIYGGAPLPPAPFGVAPGWVSPAFSPTP